MLTNLLITCSWGQVTNELTNYNLLTNLLTTCSRGQVARIPDRLLSRGAHLRSQSTSYQVSTLLAREHVVSKLITFQEVGRGAHPAPRRCMPFIWNLPCPVCRGSYGICPEACEVLWYPLRTVCTPPAPRQSLVSCQLADWPPLTKNDGWLAHVSLLFGLSAFARYRCRAKGTT